MRQSVSSYVAGAVAGVAAFALVSRAALAHHPIGGVTPSTAAEGFLSGLGHPLIGQDHFVFLVAFGVAIAAATAVSLWRQVVFLFVLSGAVGVVLRTAIGGVQPMEALVAVTLLVAGGWLVWAAVGARAIAPLVVAAFSVFAGLVHGFAWGESIVGAHSAALLSYLAGLAVVQFALLAVLHFAVAALGRSLPVMRPTAFGLVGLSSVGLGLSLVSGH